MRNIVISFVFILFGQAMSFAQILPVPEVEQEQSEWCWAGVSKCILDYYGDTTEQCEIAEYTRTVATWHSFGTVDCCNDPSQGCNYWNYNWGKSGSIQNILIYFGGIQNYGLSSSLSKDMIDDELSEARPFVIRWGWYSGGGHFVVGYGKNANTIYYMNPWYGEGMKFADYNWVVDDGNHQWTHTNVLTTSPVGVENLQTNINESVTISPNPSNGKFSIQFDNYNFYNAEISIISTNGKQVFQREINSAFQSLDLELVSGIYILRVSNNQEVIVKKLLIY